MIHLPFIFLNRRFKRVAVAIAIAILIFVTINIFVIGGDLFVYTFNSTLNAPLALGIAISAAATWRLMSTEKHNRLLWSGILIGWALWALAETIWVIYSILGQEVPYPSLADFFWILGYLPMGIGLITRIRTMPAKPNAFQNTIIVGVSILTLFATISFIVIPILQNFDPERLIESILNLIYPLADLFLVIVVWRLFFTYEEGDYGFGWRLLTLGFVFMIVSDLIFTYTTWQGLYYPDMQANLISRFGVDVPYTISYLLWFIGIYALRIRLREEHPIEPGNRIWMVRTYGHILIYTGDNDTVFDTSPNFNRFFALDDVKGKSLAEALKISQQDEGAILEKLHQEGKIADLPFLIRDHSGVSQEIKLYGLAVINPQKAYLGANLLLRMRVTDASFDDALDQESRLMARYLLEQSGSNYKDEIKQFLSDYYLSYIRALLDMAFHQGGAAIAQALLDELSETAKKHNWPVQLSLETVLDGKRYSLDVLREALPLLRETAKRFVSDITDPAIIETRMQEVNMRFSETVHQDIAHYEKPGSEVGFSDHREEAIGNRH
jgi:hypothetical protein